MDELRQDGETRTPIRPFGDDRRLADRMRNELAGAAELLLDHSGQGEDVRGCRYAEACAAVLTAVETRLLRQNLDVFADVQASSGGGLGVAVEG
jgi:hypothetical protein